MPDAYDSYREALVVETCTVWPADLPAIDAARKPRLEAQLHAEAAKAAHLEYIRLFTGFRRQITVAPADLERLKDS